MEILEGKSYFSVPVHNNIGDLFHTAVTKFKNRIAFSWRPSLNDAEPTKVTYEQTRQDVEALQAALYDENMAERRIAIIGVNSYPWAISYYATVIGLGIAVPLDPLLTAVELINLLKRGRVDTLICDAKYVQMLTPHLEELPLLKNKIVMLKTRENEKKLKVIEEMAKEHNFIDFDEFLATGYAKLTEGKKFTPKELFPDDVAALLFTSGTTSESKGVLLSHYNITSNVAGLNRIIKVPDCFRYLSILPLHHALENTCGLHTILSFGGNVCYCDGLRYISQNMQEYKPHVLIGVPALYDQFYKKIKMAIKKQNKEKVFEKILKFSDFMRKFGIDLRKKLFKKILNQFGGEIVFCISGAAKQRVDVIKFMERIGIDIFQGYGLTECAPVVAGGNHQLNPHGTCGLPIGGVTIAIDNNNPGEDGEILVKINQYPNHQDEWKNEPAPAEYKGDSHITMLGYYENNDANTDIFKRSGWLRTMDIGHIDPKSKGLVITGRAKSMIVLNSGKKVFPEEIESKLNLIDLVADSLVWAEPYRDDLTLMARLVLDGETLDTFKKSCQQKGMSEEETNAELEKILTAEIARVNSELVKFKHINHFYYSVADMIRTTTRKIKRQPEIDYIHSFFKDVRKQDGLDFNVKNLDSLMFVSYNDKVAKSAE